MNKFKKTALALLLINTALFAQAENITVFAAASLQNAIDEIKVNYEKTGNKDQIEALYDSSSNLARQIEQGAPADLFISANQSWMNYLEEKNLIDDATRTNIVKNELALITYKDNTTEYKVDFGSNDFWKATLENTRIALGDPDHVPAGLYAKEAFEKLGVWATVAPKVAAAQNVRAALLLVEVKEADLGAVYSSDASVSEKVKTVTIFPEELHEPIEYPIAIMKNQANDSVNGFYNYLLSDDAAEVFKKYGFASPSK
ncbi:molybdate ABC transporter substrate-binding protein [Ignatzschineria rhizosphaerae]|uniref:Molybdate ABC transporter substrate-binding protein n=1 Tax=Ignatzschineria rhizosphaerae TaxID=2923279 RepID=A0ABY3X034_9GAMM|nr:molybdate ABC transporter substrate-binding protein [Ignatzschineria rhizosphaerae]UNM95044.1 molybdate ABC transporter substrate-binding protein [Ignatzschineria rhizosphaerae]